MSVNQQFFFQWVVLSSTLVMATQQACWPPEACWVVRVSGPWAQRASTPATLTPTPRNTGRSKIASIQWRGGWSHRSQTPWRVWLRRRRKRKPGGCSCSSTRLPSQWNDPSRYQSSVIQFRLADLSHVSILQTFLCLFCRDNLIQAIGVDAEGKLVSMSGLMEKSIPEQRDSGSDNDGGEN